MTIMNILWLLGRKESYQTNTFGLAVMKLSSRCCCSKLSGPLPNHSVIIVCVCISERGTEKDCAMAHWMIESSNQRLNQWLSQAHIYTHTKYTNTDVSVQSQLCTHTLLHAHMHNKARKYCTHFREFLFSCLLETVI